MWTVHAECFGFRREEDVAVRLTPEDIEARRFRLAPNGYECEAVDRFLVEVIEALRNQPVATGDSDEFSRAGQEIASVLRAARDSAGAMRAEAEGLAASMRSRAEIEVSDLRRQADEEREQANLLLVDAQRRAEAIVHDAEAQVAGALASATAEAEARAREITAEAEKQLDDILRSERAAQQRLLGARTDLQQAIDRLSGTTDASPAQRSLLDLTVAPHVRSGPGTVVGGSVPAPNGTMVDPGAQVAPADAAVATDPLLRMVRAAVGRAAEHSSSHEYQDEAPAV